MLVRVLFAALLTTGSAVTYFNYATASTGNMPNAGKPQLAAIRNSSATYSFDVPNAAPGNSGRSSRMLVNDGGRTGILSVRFSPVVNTPGTIGEYADGSGDLGANAQIVVYIDVDANGDWSRGDIGLQSDGETYSYPATLNYDAVDSYGGASWNGVKTMPASAKYDFVIMWRVPITVGNEIQGDSVGFDTTFVLEDDLH